MEDEILFVEILTNDREYTCHTAHGIDEAIRIAKSLV